MNNILSEYIKLDETNSKKNYQSLELLTSNIENYNIEIIINQHNIIELLAIIEKKLKLSIRNINNHLEIIIKNDTTFINIYYSNKDNTYKIDGKILGLLGIYYITGINNEITISYYKTKEEIKNNTPKNIKKIEIDNIFTYVNNIIINNLEKKKDITRKKKS